MSWKKVNKHRILDECRYRCIKLWHERHQKEKRVKTNEREEGDNFMYLYFKVVEIKFLIRRVFRQREMPVKELSFYHNF